LVHLRYTYSPLGLAGDWHTYIVRMAWAVLTGLGFETHDPI